MTRSRRSFLGAAVALPLTGCLGDGQDEVTDEGPRVTLTVSKDVLELPNDSFVIEAINESDETFTTTPTSFVLRKRTSSRSVWLYPSWDVFSRDGPAGPIEPDDSITEEIEVSNDLNFGGSSSYEVGGIGPGEYVIDYAYKRDEYLAEDEEFEAPSTSFEVVGEPPELEPVGVREVEREGDGVVVHTDWGGNAEAILRRTDEVAEVPEMVVEQVVRMPLLRNLVYYAHEENAERVTVRGLGGTVRQMGDNMELMTRDADFEYDGRFEYDGTVYEVKADEEV